MKPIAILALLIFFLLLPVSYAAGQKVDKKTDLRISSPGLENDAPLPQKYACDGTNVNPPLKIENVPAQAKSLALILDDLDAPGGSYVHWILWNIDPNLREIQEDSAPEGAVQGLNDFKKSQYGGPCPPSRPHRYSFKIYALDSMLSLGSNASKSDLEKAMKGHILGQAQLTTSYKRK